MEKKVNVKKLRASLPSLLTPPDLPLWDRGVERERNDYRGLKFRRNAPQVEQEKFMKIVDAFAEYKEAQEKFWKGRKKESFF